jgi:hypothetical protein
MKRHPDYTLADQAHGVCPICLAPAEIDCDCEREKSKTKNGAKANG